MCLTIVTVVLVWRLLSQTEISVILEIHKRITR